MNVEAAAMTLLKDLQRELGRGLNWLGGRDSNGLSDNFLFYASSHINRAVEGFLFLRKGSRLDAAKLAIRPAIEAMLRIEAVRKKPELLYRIAYTERLELKKWVRPAAPRQGKDYDEVSDERHWTEFKRMYEEQFPNHSLREERLSLVEVARLAGLEAYYDSFYRMYCKYAHAALVAVGGYLDELADPVDSRTMVLCALSALDALASIGASFKRLDVLRQRVIDLSKQPPARLIRQR